MQTFLPFYRFTQSASVLDFRRLGKQRVEARQILDVLARHLATPKGKFGWKNHPAVLCWKGYGRALTLYYDACVLEWARRGYRNTMSVFDVFQDDGTIVCAVGMGTTPQQIDMIQDSIQMPPWLGDPDFHASHQSNLIRKDAAHYGPAFPGVPNDLPYVWPVMTVQARTQLTEPLS